MKKLILLGSLLTAITFTTKAQLSVNINIGPQPQYVPLRYSTASYYYSEPVRYYAPVRRPVYVRHVNVVKRPYYVNSVRAERRPVVYRKIHYKGNKGYFKNNWKVKGGHHGKGRR
ncbi:hypothetical protein ACXZ1K_12470 [Pedobacter sp. PWIIR3]